jgi:hypothetical protein
MKRLVLPLDADRIESHEIAMCDMGWLVDEYREYLLSHYEGETPEGLEKLVVSYSDALWNAILSQLTFADDWRSLVRKVWGWIHDFLWDLREM